MFRCQSPPVSLVLTPQGNIGVVVDLVYIGGNGKIIVEPVVKKVVSSIPKGQTLTYKDVAELAGSPRAYRAVGNIMKSNKDSKVPCHRVIKSDGTLGGYNGLKGIKKKLLAKEGVWLQN